MKHITNPLNDIDADIGAYINSYPNNDYTEVIKKNKRLEISRYLSDMPNGLFAWYPFENSADVLVIGGQFGAFLDSISRRCKKVVVVEKDGYRAYFTKVRMKNSKNIIIINSDIFDYQRNNKDSFDYIIWAIDENIDNLIKKDYEAHFLTLQKLLKPKGKVLAIIPNRLGVKFFCGERDSKSNLPFDGITDNYSAIYRFSRSELLVFLSEMSFNSAKLYYPLPDYKNPQLIYTDQYPPGEEVIERLKVYVSRSYERVLSENKFYKIMAENDVLTTFSNHFIVECGLDVEPSNVIYSALSSERSHDRAFATNICSDGKVRKVPIYDEGISGLEILKRNAEEQIKRKIPSLNIAIENNIAVMDKIEAPTLSNYIRKLVNERDKQGILKCMDMLYRYILKSSDYTSENSLKGLAPNLAWGPVLKKAYIEMIPVNCFYVGGDLLLFDQEYTMDNCPAGYVVFRAVRDIYNFIPQINNLISLEEMEVRYNLKGLWQYYLKVEDEFCKKLVNRDIYLGRPLWRDEAEHILRSNRRGISMSNESSIKLYNPVLGLDGKKLILFGAGRYADHFLDKYGENIR